MGIAFHSWPVKTLLNTPSPIWGMCWTYLHTSLNGPQFLHLCYVFQARADTHMLPHRAHARTPAHLPTRTCTSAQMCMCTHTHTHASTLHLRSADGDSPLQPHPDSADRTSLKALAGLHSEGCLCNHYLEHKNGLSTSGNYIVCRILIEKMQNLLSLNTL
jgi:hypothetical protein